MTRASRSLLLVVNLLLFAGCPTSAGPGAREPRAPQADEPPPPPPVDPLALVPEGVEGILMVRGDLLRGSDVAPLVRQVLGEEPLLAALEASGIDPLRDFDRVVAAGRFRSQEPDVLVFEHHLAEAQIVQAFGRLSQSPDASRVRIKEMEGHRVVVVDEAPARMVLASPTVAAITTAELLPAVVRGLDTPAGGAAAELIGRLRALDQRAPDLAARASIRFASMGPQDWNDGPGQLGITRPDWISGLVAFGQGASVYAHAAYATEQDAARAEDASRSILTGSFNPASLFIRLMGLGRALETSALERAGSELTLRTQLDPQEMARVIERLRAADDRG